MEIKYGISILVLIKNENCYYWFLEKKDYWIMDFNIVIEDAKDMFDDEFLKETKKYRHGIMVLNNDTIDTFLEKEENLSIDNLKAIFRNRLKDEFEDLDEIQDYFPSLFIDFDDQELYSSYPEYLTFEAYIPEGWEGFGDSFWANFIDENLKYWIVNEIDYLDWFLDRLR